MTSLGYEGKRVVVMGAASGIGRAATQLLVDLGAEVHAVDARKPEISALASFTECELRDIEQIGHAAKKIGAIVNALFNCAGDARAMTDAVIPNMIEGSAIATIGAYEEIAVPEGIRVNFVKLQPHADNAWPIVFLNSPRAAGITGQEINQAR